MEELRSRAMGALAMTVDPDVVEVSALAGVPPTYPAYLEFVAALERPGPASVPRFLRAASLDTLFTLPLLWAAYWGEGYGPAACGVPLDSVLGSHSRWRERGIWA